MSNIYPRESTKTGEQLSGIENKSPKPLPSSNPRCVQSSIRTDSMKLVSICALLGAAAAEIEAIGTTDAPPVSLRGQEH